jgi:DNA gyrase subunit A
MGVVSQEDMLANGSETARTVLAVSENGYGKRTAISAYSTTRRGSMGVITLKTTARNGYLAGLMIVDKNEELLIITQEGMIIRQPISEISVISRNTQGVRLINLKEGDKVRDITNVPSEEDDEIIEKGVAKLSQPKKEKPPVKEEELDDLEDLDDEEIEIEPEDEEDEE